MPDFKYQNTALCGALLCLSAVAFGAFGSHALDEILISNQREAVFELANRYQFYHGLALLVFAALFQLAGMDKYTQTITWVMAIGAIIFSGSLYCLAITNVVWLGAITPIGGSLMIFAWGLFGWQIHSAKKVF